MNLSARIIVIGGVLIALTLVGGESRAQLAAGHNDALYKTIKEVHGLNDAQLEKVKAIFEKSGYIGQGNPKVTKHPMTEGQCREKLKKLGVEYANPEFEKICGGKYMAPLYKQGEPETAATACIDQFEFPSVPCEYPVIWVKAKEAAEICEAVGKRLCDAHEWEGACAGSLDEPDYPFAAAQGVSEAEGFRRMRAAHNKKHAPTKSWAYGASFQKGVCAQDSVKSASCNGGNWQTCGSNTYPAGSFPDCTSSLKVYDIHGNAAEHMNLPLNENQMASRGSKELGQTEMKGSWFIWDKFQAHQDWCRWRAPYWHGSRVMVDHSHANYHLSFRCCKTIEPPPPKRGGEVNKKPDDRPATEAEKKP